MAVGHSVKFAVTFSAYAVRGYVLANKLLPPGQWQNAPVSFAHPQGQTAVV